MITVVIFPVLVEFWIIALHAKPECGVTERELEQLAIDYYSLKKHLKFENAIIIGDLNYGRPYVDRSRIGKLKLDTDKEFQSLISSPSTVKTGMPYDRAYLAGRGEHTLWYFEDNTLIVGHCESNVMSNTI